MAPLAQIPAISSKNMHRFKISPWYWHRVCRLIILQWKDQSLCVCEWVFSEWMQKKKRGLYCPAKLLCCGQVGLHEEERERVRLLMCGTGGSGDRPVCWPNECLSLSSDPIILLALTRARRYSATTSSPPLFCKHSLQSNKHLDTWIGYHLVWGVCTFSQMLGLLCRAIRVYPL